MNTQTAIDLIFKEIQSAVDKYPQWPTGGLDALAVLGEEYGELNKSVLQLTYEPHKTSVEEMQKEAVQTAAMAIRFLLSIDKYEFKPSSQHDQVFSHL